MVGKEGLAPSQPAAMVLQTIGLPTAQFPQSEQVTLPCSVLLFWWWGRLELNQIGAMPLVLQTSCAPGRERPQSGPGGGQRSPNLPIKSRLLCQLSYTG